MNTNFSFVFSPEADFSRLSGSLKDVVLPQKIFIEDNKLVVWGYFSSYSPEISENNLIEELEKHGFRRFANNDCEYLLFVWNKLSQELLVGADNLMSFSCYFLVLDREIVFSSDFAVIKDFAAKKKALVADLDGLLTYIVNGPHITERTILESVKQVPAGSVVRFSFIPRITYEIKSLVDIDAFLAKIPPVEIKDEKEFAQLLESALRDSLARRLRKIPAGTAIGCEISSGFDCTLVAYLLAKLIGAENFYCYTFYFPEKYGTESLKVISKFAAKHSLKLRAVKLDPEEGYARDYFTLWQNNDLFQLRADYFGGYINLLERYQPRLLFTGQHGDETYSMRDFILMTKYPRQMSYFDNVRWLKRENQAVFYTKKGLDLFLSWQRFDQWIPYPVFYSDINLAETALIDQIYRRFGTRQISPYLDLTVLSVGLRKNLRSKKIDDEKQLYLRHLDHIFIPEMFVPKKGGTEFALGFPRNQKRLISWVLENSVLAQYQIIDIDRIKQMLADESSPLYQDPFIALAFEYLIRADWYLIKNEITLPLC